jgi:2-methylcitrate dehydratase PrpD
VVAGAGTPRSVEHQPEYGLAFTDWLACACAGTGEPAAKAMRAAGEDLIADVAFAATAGHALDFDDTFAAGVAHVSAACAPAALVCSSHLGLALSDALDAYAAGFEAMAALAAASHPALYDGGWHPTAVCAPVGAAVVASRLLELSDAETQNALALALLRAGGTRGAFGSDGKAIQVGLATAAGVQAVILAREGARVDPRAIHGPVGFEAVVGATWAAASPEAPAILGNWIKLHPSCLGTHAPIDAVRQARDANPPLDREPLEVVVHPLARQAAPLDSVGDGLSAKFSIPYCVAHTAIHGPPRVRDFATIDPAVCEHAALVAVTVDASLPEFGAVLIASGQELARVRVPRGAPERPIAPAELAAKVRDLAGDRLEGVLDDPGSPTVEAVNAAGLAGCAGSGAGALRSAQRR